MKVLLINGSPRAKGNTYTALHEMEKVFLQEGIETELLHIGNQVIRAALDVTAARREGSVFLKTR